MLYELSATSRHGPRPRVAEPPMRYRRRGAARKPSASGDAPTEQIERSVRNRDKGARWQRILSLSARVSAGLSDAERVAWLELEESLHDYWLDVAIEHYRIGAELGFARVSEFLDQLSPLDVRVRLRLLAGALSRLLDELEGEDGPT